VPLELKLLKTAQGPRLSFMPVKELESLRDSSKKVGPIELKTDEDALAGVKGELLDIRLEFEPPAAGSAVELNVHGVVIRYEDGQITVNGHKAAAPARGGKQRLMVLVDRNSLEVFAADGLTYVPFPFIAKEGNQSVSLIARGGSVKVDLAEVYTLKSPWDIGH
jgi:sucrose-6-phosphate hydrolase SacC (GH32 family)